MKSHSKFLGKKRRKGDKNNVGYYIRVAIGRRTRLLLYCY